MSRRSIATCTAAALLVAAGAGSAQSIMSVRDAVALALRRDPRVLEADARQAQAAGEAGVFAARFGPSLFTGAGAVYTYGFPQTPGGSPPSIFSLGMTQTLFDGVSRGRQRAAEDRLEVSKVAAGGVRDATAVETAVTYLELATVRRTLERLRSAADSSEQVVTLISERLREGRAIPVDVLQTRLSAARVRQRIVQLEGRELVLDIQLHSSTGVPAAEPVTTVYEELPLLPDRSISELVAMASANDPDLKSAELERHARADILAGEQAGYWPSVDFVGNYAVLSKFNNFDTFFNRFQRHNLNVGVEVRVPIFNASTGPAVSLAKSQLVEADATIRRHRDGIELSVRQAVQRAHDAAAARTVAEIQLAIAQENVRVTQARVAEGRADRLDAEKTLVEEAQAWDALLAAGLDQQATQLQLRRLTGELNRLFP
jgi:outer membrane protein TolC